MEALVVEQEDVRLCKINIDGWNSAVARQHSIQSIPQLLLYNGRKQVATGTAEVMRHLASR